MEIIQEKDEKITKIEKIDEDPNKILVTDFSTGKKQVIEADRVTKCSNFSKPCAKFIVASVISIGTSITGAFLLFNPSTTLVTIGASLLSANLSYWVKSPSMNEKQD